MAEVNFRLLEEDLDEYGFPKLQITWADETKVYNLSEDHSAKTGIDFIQFEYEWNLVEAFGLAVLHTNNEITALTAPDASEKLSVIGNAQIEIRHLSSRRFWCRMTLVVVDEYVYSYMEKLIKLRIVPRG